MGTTHLAMACVSLALFSTAAAAQTQSETPSIGTIPLTPNLSVTPTVFYESGYDTDLLRTAGGGPGAEKYVAPQIEGWFNRGHTEINFQSAIALQDAGGASNWNRYGATQINSDGGLFGYRALASHRNHYAPPTDFVGFELGIKSRRVENTFEGEFRLQPVNHRIRASVVAKRLGLRYDADQRFQGSSLQFNLNRDTTISSGKVGWALTPLTSVTASVDLQRDHFLFVQGADGHGRTLMVGVETRPLGIMTGTAQWGQLTYTDDVTGRSLSVPTFDVALTLSRGRSTLTINGSRLISFSFNAGSGFYVQTGLDTYLSMKLGKSFEPFVRHMLRRVGPQDLIGPDAAAAFTGVQKVKGGLAYRVGRMRFGPEVEVYEHHGPGGFSGWRAIGFLIFGSDRVLWMDRPLIGEW